MDRALMILRNNIFFIITLILVNKSIQSQTISKFQENGTSTFFLIDESKQNVESSLNDVVDFYNQLDSTLENYENPKISYDGNQQFYFHEITDLFPSPLLSLPSKESTIAGPNCFNSALYGKNSAKYIRYSSPDEINFYLKNFCEIIPKAEYSNGTIIAFFENKIKQNNFQIYHTFYWINDKIAYNKSGLTRLAGFEFINPTRIHQFYFVPIFNQYLNNIPRDLALDSRISIGFNCPTSLNSFMNKFLESSPNTNLAKHIIEARNIEKIISTTVLTGKDPYVLSDEKLTSVIDQNTDKLKMMLSISEGMTEETTIIKYLLSLYQSFRESMFISPTD